MDTFEFNKIAGAVLGAALFVLLVSTLSGALFDSHPPEEPVYLASLATSEGTDDGRGSSGDEEEESIAMLLASADAGAGEKVAKKCAACHTFDNGGADKQGPNLWNIVNRPIGSIEGFKYSAVLSEMAGGGKVWDFDSLDSFLRKPKDFAKGTKMAFGGIKKGTDRASLLAYMRALSDSPAPLPEAGDHADAASDATQTAAAMPENQASDAATTETAAAPAETMEKPAESESGTDMAAAPSTETSAESTPTAETTTETAAAESEPASMPTAETEAPSATETEAAATTPESEKASEAAAESKPMDTAAAAPSDEPAGAAPSESGGESGGEPAAGVLAMVGSQDVADGVKVARKCKACHSFDEGGKNKSGPPLWDIVNRPVGVAADFRYSKAMMDFAGGSKTWTYEELDAYLAAPKKHVPKTKMSFAGLKKEKDRAAILAYLRSLSADPAPLP